MNYKEKYRQWLTFADPDTKAELESLTDEKEIEDRFYKDLAFGTGGLRGIMGVGLYRMNVHVIRHATQAFAEVIRAEGPEAVKRGIKAGDLVKSVCAICGGKVRRKGNEFLCENGHQGNRFLNDARNLGRKCQDSFFRRSRTK